MKNRVYFGDFLDTSSAVSWSDWLGWARGVGRTVFFWKEGRERGEGRGGGLGGRKGREGRGGMRTTAREGDGVFYKGSKRLVHERDDPPARPKCWALAASELKSCHCCHGTVCFDRHDDLSFLILSLTRSTAKAVSLKPTEGTEKILFFNFSAERAEKLKPTLYIGSYIYFFICRPLSGRWKGFLSLRALRLERRPIHWAKRARNINPNQSSIHVNYRSNCRNRRKCEKTA